MLYIIIGVVITIVIILVIYVIATHNSLGQLKTMTDEAFALMDVYLEKRWELLPKLLDVAKAWSKYEYETLMSVAENRNYHDLDKDSKITQNQKIDYFIGRIEDYPELQAITGYLDLMEQIKTIENEIANSRKYYNGVVRAYNTKLVVFPSNLIAKMFKYEQRKMYECTTEQAK